MAEVGVFELMELVLDIWVLIRVFDKAGRRAIPSPMFAQCFRGKLCKILFCIHLRRAHIFVNYGELP
jgi:hypothetical protein